MSRGAVSIDQLINLIYLCLPPNPIHPFHLALFLFLSLSCTGRITERERETGRYIERERKRDKQSEGKTERCREGERKREREREREEKTVGGEPVLSTISFSLSLSLSLWICISPLPLFVRAVKAGIDPGKEEEREG